MRYSIEYWDGWKVIDTQTGKSVTVQDIATAYNKLERRMALQDVELEATYKEALNVTDDMYVDASYKVRATMKPGETYGHEEVAQALWEKAKEEMADENRL